MQNAPWPATHFALLAALALTPVACTDDGDQDDHDDHADHETESGDGDGDPGDGDGDPTGDGDGDGDGEPTGDGDGEPTGDGDGDGDGDGETLCGTPSCEDAMILDLSLQGDEISEGLIENTPDGDGWQSSVDATAGGTMMSATNPWIYARFTDDGLVKVEIDDLEALESGAWDIAAKRFGVRVNSGTSGPGCVGVAAAEAAFESITEVPGDAEFASENFYDEACTLIEDGSGLPGNPDYLMKSWWGYSSCVTTTGAVFVVELGDGRHVALTIDAYYAEGQEQCNEQGTMGSGSANLSWRWRYLD